MVLFPGFFFYHLLLGIGATRAFLGGYFTPVSLIFSLPLVFLYIRQFKARRYQLSLFELYFGIFLVFFSFIVGINALIGAEKSIVVGHIEGFLFMVNAYLLFRMIDFTQGPFRYLAGASLIGMSAVIFAFSTDGMFRMDTLGLAKDPAALSTYQGFARSYLVTFLCVIPYTRSRSLRLALYVIGAFSLYLNTARSEFVALLFCIPIIELYFSKNKLLFTIVVASIAWIIIINFDAIEAQLPNNRILELLDLSHSNSAILRRQMMAQAVQTVSNHPVMGDFASYAPGHYAHNIFSAWVDLGFFGFAYLVVLIIFPGVSLLVSGYFTSKAESEFILVFSFICATILLLIKSHNFTDMLIGACFGAYSRYRYKRRSRRRAMEPAPATKALPG